MSDDPSKRAARLPLADADRVDRKCDRFEAAWKAGERPRIEDFLDEADGAVRAVLLQELICAEVERRLRRGERPQAGEYFERFPGHGALIGRVLDGLTLPGARGSDRVPASGDAHTHLASAAARGSSGLGLPVIAGFEVLGELGRGGMGVVYKARELRLHRIVALKMILTGAHASQEAMKRFLNEAEVIARLRHPNIVQIYGMGDHEGHPYIELEHVGGRALSVSLDGTPWPSLRAAGLMQVLARAVHEAHRQGVVHRDLKPSNILLTEAGEPKIADFGLAKAVGSGYDLTRTESVLGSPSYMAPEQAEGRARDVGPAADVYALGAVFYELLTGRPPFKAATALATLEQVRTAEPVVPSRFQPGLPRDAETICLKCLEKDARRRYLSAEELADDLRRFLACEPVRARPVGPFGRTWRWCVREPRVAGLLASLALVVVAGFAGISWQWRRAESEATRARGEARAATRARAQSDTNFQRARVLVEDLTKTAIGMAGQPRLEKARRALLERLVDFQIGFLQEKSDDPEVMLETARAFGRVAHIRSELDQNDRAADAIRRQGELLDRLLARDPSNPAYRFARAWCLFDAAMHQAHKDRRFETARESYERAIAIHEGLITEFPGDASYRGGLSITLANWAALRRYTGHMEDAERVFPRIIQLGRDCLSDSPGNRVYRQDLAISIDEYGNILWRTGRHAEATAACHEALGMLVALRNERPGVSHLDAFEARVRSRLAEFSDASGSPVEAEDGRRQSYLLLEGLVAAYPDVVEYRRLLATAAVAYARPLKLPGGRDAAVAAWRVAVNQYETLAADFPDDETYPRSEIEVRLALAQLLASAGDAGAALEFQKVLKLQPQNYGALNELAWFLASGPDPGVREAESAVELATKALTVRPKSANAWNTLGLAHYRAGDPSSAKAALEKSIGLRSGGAEGFDWVFLAMTCSKLGERDQARDYYEKAVRWIAEKRPDDEKLARFRDEAEALLGVSVGH